MGTDVLWARVYISFQCMSYGRNMIIGCMEIGLRKRILRADSRITNGAKIDNVTVLNVLNEPSGL